MDAIQAVLDAGIGQIVKQVKEKKISAVEVVNYYLSRIERYNESLGCFMRLNPELIEDAKRVDAAVLNGQASHMLLCGVPVGIKDMIVTRGLETNAASKVLQGWIPPYDATVVRKIKEHGGLIVGKLNMDEFAMGSSNENSSWGLCRNPWDTHRVPGGSSGGSAASVAADLCTVSLGTDTGGSIRQPAALCGVTGLKPTYGRVSRYGAIAFASSMDQIGPLGKSAEDIASMMQVLSGHDVNDSTSLQDAVPDYKQACQRTIKGVRIGIPKEYFEKGLDPRIEQLIKEALSTLEKQGAKLVPVSLPHTKYGLSVYYILATAEASSNLSRYDGVRYGYRHKSADTHTLVDMYEKTRTEGFGEEVKRRILLGTYVLRSGYYDAYFKQAAKVRTLIRNDFSDAFALCDVIATPTSPVPAFPIGERIEDPMTMYLADVYTLNSNLAGIPAMSMPCGFVEEKAKRLPVGLQLMAPSLREDLLLQCAAEYQRQTEHHVQKPNLA